MDFWIRMRISALQNFCKANSFLFDIIKDCVTTEKIFLRKHKASSILDFIGLTLS